MVLRVEGLGIRAPDEALPPEGVHPLPSTAGLGFATCTPAMSGGESEVYVKTSDQTQILSQGCSTQIPGTTSGAQRKS